MERRSCSNLHFINAIKGSSVMKISNVDSCCNSPLVFKNLKDTYDSEVLTPDTHSSNVSVKSEKYDLLLAVRRLREMDASKNEDLPCCSDGDTSSDSNDYTFGKMTLKELKKSCKTKKRKRGDTPLLNPPLNQVKLEQEDDSDLGVPLINLKLKTPKAKMKCMRDPEPAALAKHKFQDLEPKRPLQVHMDLLSSVKVKIEFTESEIEGCQNVISSGENPFTQNHKDESTVSEVMSKTHPSSVGYQSPESNLCGEDYQNCALNKVSFDYLEKVELEPPSVLLPSDEEMLDVKDQEKWCKPSLHLSTSENGKDKQQSTSPVKDQSAGGNECSTSCDLHESSGISTSNHAVGTPCAFVDDSDLREEPNCDGVSLHPQDPSSNNAESILSKDDKSEGMQPLECKVIDSVNNNLNNGTHLDVMEDELSLDEERQPPLSASVDAENVERDSMSCSQNYAFGESSSSPVGELVPERLLSTRKVVSPTSEERFCLAMNSAGSYEDMELLDCNKDVCNEEQTEIQSSCEQSDKHNTVSKIPQVSTAVSRVKFVLSPSHIRRKAKKGRTSPPKSNMEGPRISRSIPSVNTGCTSIQGCSESAIAFSRRQMQDIESLAMKLMSELKCMKDIVEEKLLFEAYRNHSSKNEADEVKNAITCAIKAEEMAKKWLSMMGRDCNRFCKIMSLAQKDSVSAASNNTVQRDRKRITFADEAGGKLCHFKFFENGLTSLKPETEKQEDGAR